MKHQEWPRRHQEEPRKHQEHWYYGVWDLPLVEIVNASRIPPRPIGGPVVERLGWPE